MSEIIENFYKDNHIPAVLLKQKMAKFDKYPDIAAEFEYWINNKKYLGNGVNIEGYNSQKLLEQSQYLDGEGVFIMLIELRENPSKALGRLADGFKRK